MQDVIIMKIFKKICCKKPGKPDIELYNISWYPNSQSCLKMDIYRATPAQMPPLMVRKAAWRR
jgi:hypothetical protein